jgi:predicted Zn-dependent protease
MVSKQLQVRFLPAWLQATCSRAARLRVTRVAGVIAAAGLLGVMTACSVNPATGSRSFTGLMSAEDEQQIGAEEHPKLVEAFGGKYDDPALQSYVTSIGELLHSTSEMRQQPFRFVVLDSPIVNAFALPGGYVHISRGLMALANDEAELAGVVAHEIGHVTARHSAQRYSHGVVAGLGAALLGAVTGSREVASLGQLAASAYVQGYSRDQEFQADQLGVRYLGRAGYDPLAMSTFLESMGAEHRLALKIAGQEGANPGASLFSSHPRTADRVARAARDARASHAGAKAHDRALYLRKIDGMVWGDSAAQGFVRGREFDHPVLRLRFTAPPGFKLQNGAEALMGEHPNGAVMVFDGDTVKRTRSSTLAYVRDQWAPNLRLDGIEGLTIGGLEAATAAGRISTADGPADVRLVAIRWAPDQVFRFLFVTPPSTTARLDEDVRRAAHSFRRLSGAEAAALKPLRIRVVKVRAGDTINKMARRMMLDEFGREWFQVLNGLAPGAVLTPGQLVKIVAR